jgi:hypothetical protein
MTKSLVERQPLAQRETDAPAAYELQEDAADSIETTISRRAERAMGFKALGGPISLRELESPHGVSLFPTEM